MVSISALNGEGAGKKSGALLGAGICSGAKEI